MIEGVVNATYEAVVTLSLIGPSGPARQVEAVIDTGYTGFLTLPPSLVEELGLPFRFSSRGILANGSEEAFGVYGVTVLWDGRPRYIDADAVGPTPLIGMLLLAEHDLSIRVRDGGPVAIRPAE